jgi:outer membrane protein assembly factor BamB
VTTAGDWPTYLHDAQRSGASLDETTLTTQNVNQLVQRWAFKTGGIVAASPTVVGGVVYVGSWDGYEYALNANNGSLLWQTFLGTTIGGPSCHAPSKAGISSVATVADGVVYVGGGDSYWYALNAKNGSVLWRLFTGDNSAASGHYNWSSPLIANGYAYIGVASLADCPLVQGELLQVNLASHQLTNTFKVVPDGQVGGGIWTSPSLDPAANTIYVTTGTWTDPTVEPYAQAILALDASTLSLKSSWQLPRIAAVNDSDWGDTPLLFVDASGHPRIAAINKNGVLYAFDRNNLAAGPVWTSTVAIGGQCPLCGDGSVSSGAFAAGRIYFAGGMTTLNGSGFTGAVRALDPGDGHAIWQHGSPAPVIPAIAYADGFVVDGAGRYLEVLDAGSGSRLYSAMLPATFYAPPSVANGTIFVATTDGSVSAFRLGPAPKVPSDPNCPAGWTCQDIGQPQPSGTEQTSGMTWNVTAGGSSIGATTDQFRFVSQIVPGDSQVTGAVTAMQGGTSGGQAGLMLRQRQDANAPYYAVLATVGGGLSVQERRAFGAATVVLKQVPLGTFPLYLEIRRTGDWFQAAQSVDGKTYTLIPGTTIQLVMPTAVMEGAATSSGAAGTSIIGSYAGVATGPPGAMPTPAPSPDPCPAGWNCQDVGNPAIVGDQRLSNGTWTISGAGTDIGSTADQFHFVWQPEAGDTTLSARVVSQTAVGVLAKAGLMIRQSLSDPASTFYGVFLTPGSGIVIQFRGLEGLKTTSLPGSAGTAPAFLQVTRSASTFCGFTSADGTAWSYIPGSCASVSMTGTLAAGLAVSSRNVATSNTATVDSIAIAASAPPPPTICPTGWTCTDIGYPAMAGSQSVSNGSWSVVANGDDIWGTWDQFHFVYQALAGDGTVSARAVSVTEPDPWAKAGVMIRQSPDPDAAFYAIYLTALNGITVQYRPDRGAAALMVSDTAGTGPVYLRVSRSNMTFCAYTSTDGVTWTYVVGSCQPLAVSGAMLAGMAVTSHNATHYAIGTLDSVAFTNTAPPSPTGCPDTWTCADIGQFTPAGSQSVTNGSWSITGGGADINGTSDQFHFAWQTLIADGVVSARVVSQSNTNAWAKAGVMLRDSFDPASPFYFAFMTPGNGIAVEYRSGQGAMALGLPALPGAPPGYLEVTRTGSTFCAYTSTDGATWTYMNHSCVSMNLGGAMLAGLAVTSHNASALSAVTFDTVTVSNAIPPASPCPAGWGCADIGLATPAGTQALNGTTWTVTGGGSDIWGAADQFHLVWQTLSGDGTVTAQVVSQTNTSTWAKAGVMLRQSTDPGAPFYAAYVTPSNGVAVTYRPTPNASVIVVATMSNTTPIYLRVARAGITFCAYTSSDGTTWTYVPQSCQVFQVSGTMLAGLAVTSHDPTQLSTVSFASVSLTAGAPPVPTGCQSGWTCADIGSPAPSGGQSVSGGSWTITGGGADINGTYDQFHYAWQSLPADGAISARVVSQSNTNAWAKGGVMLRQSFDPGAAFYAVFATPGNGVQVQYRPAAGMNVASAGSVPGLPPQFFEVTRTGSTFCGYTSSDGVTWAYVNGSCTGMSVSGTMLAGLAATSHDTSTLSTVKADSIVVSATIPPAAPCVTAWSCADIGSVTPAGAQSMTATGTWNVSGGGPDIAGTADAFHFVWQAIATDLTLRARVTAQGNTDGWAKGGVMLRQSTDPQSPFYAVLLTPANGVVVEARLGFGSAAQIVVTQAEVAPAYLEIGRSGDTLRAYGSSDGVVWSGIPGSAVNLPFSGSMLAGLAVSSHSPTALSAVTLDSVSVIASAPPPAACPVGWTCGDIGSVTPAGAQSVSTSGSWTIEGGGPDIWGTDDAFHFVWQTLAADGAFQARVASQQNTNVWAKAGVMLRQSIDPGSPYYAVLVTPAQGIVVQYRAVSGGTTAVAAQLAGAAPVFVEVGRSGSTFTAYTSADGVTWTAIPGSATILSMPGGVLEGMAVTSHTGVQAGFATFDAVKPG